MKFFTTITAGDFLGVSERRVRKLCEQGRLGGKNGRNWIITDADLKRFKKLPRSSGNSTNPRPRTKL